MKTTITGERTQSIVSDSYALWGTLPTGPADPPEPTPEERERARLANRITYSQPRLLNTA
jgi:hypothetical protein